MDARKPLLSQHKHSTKSCAARTTWTSAVGNITFSYPEGILSFPRTYVKGFVSCVGTSHFTWDGEYLEFYYLYPVSRLVCGVYDHYIPASSNYYSLDYVFDPDKSTIYQSGIPTPATVPIAFRYVPEDLSYRIMLVSQLTIDPLTTVDYDQPTGYWRPQA